MATGTTTTADVIVPEVWSDLAMSQFVGQAVVFNSPAAVTSDQLVGQPGKIIDFPKWGLLSDLEDLTEGTPMVPEKLAQTNSQATVKEAGKAVEFTDQADLYGIGSPGDEARRQFGLLAARKVDADLITAALAAGSLTSAITGALTWGGVVDAMAKFGDEWEPNTWSLFVRSEQIAQVYKDATFIAAAQAAGANMLVTHGQLGVIGGSRVYPTNRLPLGKAALVKDGALGCLYKRRPIVEQDRDILARTTVVTTNLHYAVKRLKDNGVVTITLT